MKPQKAIKLLLSLAVVSSSFAGALANDAVLNSDPIDINGYVQEVPPTDQELEQVKNDVRMVKQQTKINKSKTKSYKKLAKETEKLADTSEELIEERKEAQAIANAYKAKVDCLMGRDSGEQCDQYVKKDTISTKMAAPAKVEAKIEDSTNTPLSGSIKVLPYIGMASINSENEELNSNISMGLRVESDITTRLSIGLGINYMTVDTTDEYLNTYSSGYYYGANNSRDIEYKNLSFDFYGKFFITKTNRFRPYVGAGLAYNRVSSEYVDSANNNYYSSGIYNNSSSLNESEVTTNNVGLRLMAGSEILFTKSIGLNLELQYAKGFGNSSSDGSYSSYNAYQQRLEDLTDELNDSNIISVQAGLLVVF